MPGFEDAQKAEAPAWMQDAQSLAVLSRSGRDRDAELAPSTGKMMVAVKCRFADVCPDDALDEVGDTRNLERFPGESNDVYRGRLKVAFSTWRKAGTAAGIAASLEAFCTALGATEPVITILENWQGAFTDGSDWYSRFVVCIQGATWVGNELGVDFVIGESTLGSTATAAEIRSVKRQIRKWKDVHSLPVLIRVALVPAELLGVDWTIGSSALAAPEDVVEWVMMPLLGVDWMLGTSALGAYNME